MFIQSTLFTDPQAQTDICRCEHCGGTCYGPGYHCIRCERRSP